MQFISILKNKIEFAFKIAELFDKEEKLKFLLIMILSIFASFFQAAGIVSVLPFMSVVMDPTLIVSNESLFYFYNLFNLNDKNTFIIYTGFLVLFIIVIGNIINGAAQWLKFSFIWRNNHKISTALLRKYLSLPYDYFLNQNTQDLGKNILAEVQNLTFNFIYPLLKVITGSILTVIIFAVLLYINLQMTLIAASTFTILYLSIFFSYSKRIQIGGQQRVEENTRRFQAAGEALGGIKDVKISGKEKYFINQFSKYSERFNYLEAWHQIVSKIPKYILEIFAFGGVVVLILFLVKAGQSSSEFIPLIGFFAFAGYRLLPALQDIFDSLVIFRFNKAVLRKIHKDMSQKPLDREKLFNKDISLQPISFNSYINLENISFSYKHSTKKVLDKVSLTIKKNTSVAIIGTTGSGKTTIADIILGLLSPQKGEMLIDGLKISEKNIRNWQQNIGYVPQYIYLSDNTITRNIAFGISENEIKIEQVKNVARMANIDQFIENELPDQYQTIIGERGIRLSGGQKQRLGIARALYRDPKVLVFDEATSSLDNFTEKMVLDAIDHIAKFKTMIIIAHRLTTIKNCDAIYLIDKGKIVSSGTYDELLKSSEQFRKLVKSNVSK